MESTNIKHEISELETFIGEVHRNLRESKGLAESTRSEIVGMEKNVGLMTDDTPKTFSPQISEIYKDFHQEVQHQADVNEYFQKQLTELKKIASVIRQKLVDSNTKSEILESSVGIPIGK